MKRRISRRFRPTMTSSLDQLESRQLLTTGFQLVTSVSGLTPAAVAAISPTDVVAVGSGTLANGDHGAEIARTERKARFEPRRNAAAASAN
jgi:hypothetical protein